MINADYVNPLTAVVAFPAPVAPPADPVIPVNPTAAHINEAVHHHQEAVKIFKHYLDTDKALVHLVIAATPDMYIKMLQHADFRYANVTTLALLTHLKATYGTMTAADRDANLVHMHAPWPLQHQLKISFCSAGRTATLAAEPIADSQLTRIGLQLISKCGMFPDGCRE
jgi:hypothetical protein